MLAIGMTGCSGKFQIIDLSPFEGNQIIDLSPFEGKTPTYSDEFPQLRPPTPTYSHAAIEVTTNLPDVALEVAHLREELRILLGKFMVAPVGENRSLTIKVDATKVRKVSTFKRLFLVYFAGRAKVTARVLFVDSRSGDELGSYTISGFGSLFSHGGDEDSFTAVRRCAEGIEKKARELFKSR
jgi:hypothetical protein